MGRVKIGLVVEDWVDRAVEHLMADTGAAKSMLYELGARLLLAVLRHGRVPDDLGFALAERDPEALRQLQQLLAAAAGQPTYEVA